MNHPRFNAFCISNQMEEFISIQRVICNFQDHEETKAELAKQKEELVAVKKESHKRKKLLIAQQQLIHAGSGSYNKVSSILVPVCKKMNVN